MQYFALYSHDYDWEKGVPPVGIIIDTSHYGPTMESYVHHAMHWSHWEKAWKYDPEGNGRVLESDTYTDRIRPISREEAEEITPAITDGESLPSEETIMWIFQWKGQPPRSGDF